jgi:hypothetical protein
VGISKQQASETLGWYEQGLIEILEHMDQALEASDQAGDALSKGDVIKHLQAMRRVVLLLTKTERSMLQTGKQIGLVLHAIPC